MQPQIGQVIRMCPVSLDEEKNKQVYKSRIADVNGNEVIVEVPLNEKTGRIGYFAVGTSWNIWYIGKDRLRYDFQTQIIGRKTENVPLLVLRFSPQPRIQRTQRRNYLRVDMNVELAVRVDDHFRNYHFLTKSKDVSGGGLAFTCDETYRLMDNERIKIWMALPTRNGQVLHASAVGQITRIQPTEIPNKLSVSVKFIEISEVDQSKVVRACFERQLDMRKKGLID